MMMMSIRVVVLFVTTLAGLAIAQPADPERLTLAQAEEIALRNNPRIGAAEADAQASAQTETQIRSSLYPTLSANLTGAGAPTNTRLAAGGLNNPVIYSRFASGVSASQLLFDFGRTSTLAQSAALRANAQFETSKATRADVLLNVHRAYLAGLRADAVSDIARQAVASRQAMADYARALADSKLKSELDVRFAEVSLAEARLLLETADNDRRAADAELSSALGYSDMRRFQLVQEPSRELPSTDPARLVSEALAKRPEFAGRRFDLEAARRLVEAERKLRFPAVSAMASVGATPFYAQGLGNNHFAAVGLNVTMPFLNGGLFTSRRVEAQYKATAAQRRLDELQQRIARDVAVAVISAQSAAQRMALSAQLVQQATLALDLAQARYDLGLSSIVELSQAQLARTNAEIQQASARYDYQLQRTLVGYQIGELQ
jgi:outer membrane protein